MKKKLTTILIVASLMMATALNAQDKPVTFGVKAGLNLSNMSGEDNGEIKPGFNAGVTVDFRLMPNLYILSGLEYSLEGSKGGDAKINLSYLKMPMHIGYKLPVVEDNVKIVFHAGPHLAYAVDGKVKEDGVSIDLYSDLVKAGGLDVKRFDLGLGFGVGAEITNFCFNIGCDFGLIDQFEYNNEDSNGKNMNINISVGYKF